MQDGAQDGQASAEVTAVDRQGAMDLGDGPPGVPTGSPEVLTRMLDLVPQDALAILAHEEEPDDEVVEDTIDEGAQDGRHGRPPPQGLEVARLLHADLHSMAPYLRHAARGAPMPSPFPNAPPHQRGKLLTLRHKSSCLADNPWGDPAERDVHVYLPPDYDPHGAYPAILILPAFAGTGEGLLARGLGDVSIATRIDRVLAAGDCPPFVAVLPDAMTTLGGSQYVNSPAIGAYQTWIAEEIPAFVSEHASIDGRWAAVGRSSGGYGALRLAVDRPGWLAAVACHAGDMGFELTYVPDVRAAIRGIQKLGGLDGFHERFWAKNRPSGDDFAAFNLLAMAAAYAPDPSARPFPATLPFDPETGEVFLDRFEAWKAHDPLVFTRSPAAREALSNLELLFLDAGESDEYGLQLSLRRLVAQLVEDGVPFEHEEHPGGHRGTAWRYDISLPKLARALDARR